METERKILYYKDYFISFYRGLDWMPVRKRKWITSLRCLKFKSV